MLPGAYIWMGDLTVVSIKHRLQATDYALRTTDRVKNTD